MRNQKIAPITLVTLLILMAAGSIAWADQASQPTPKLVVENSSYEFDPVVDGTLVNHDFVVRNEGDAVLNIQKVKTG
jgi:hypothetical protein